MAKEAAEMRRNLSILIILCTAGLLVTSRYLNEWQCFAIPTHIYMNVLLFYTVIRIDTTTVYIPPTHE